MAEPGAGDESKGGEEDPREIVERMNAMLVSFVPLNCALGLELISMDRDRGEAVMRLPYRADFVGDPDNGILHGGVITSLLDACCGAAVFVRLWAPEPIATLDLRIDYLKPATPPRDVIARANCYRTTRNVAFVRAVAHCGDENDPIASAAGTFMRGTPGQALANAGAKT